MLVGKGVEGEGGVGGRGDEGGVEENQASLGKKTILCY